MSVNRGYAFPLIKYRLKSTNLFCLLIVPFVTLLAMEIFYNGDFFSVYSWILQYPKQFLLSKTPFRFFIPCKNPRLAV